jgi:two-component system sensor histidine kinase AlgZ
MKHPPPSVLASVAPAVRTVLLTILLWAAISALGALQTYSDNLRIGVVSAYFSLLRTWFIEYAVPLIMLSIGLSLALARWPRLIAATCIFAASVMSGSCC